MDIKNDLLIFGFTGPFCSGSTTAAQFFSSNLKSQKKDKVAKKNDVTSGIATFYDEKEGNKADNFETVLSLMEERQVINTLESASEKNFNYISMTTMMYALLVKHCFDKNVTARLVPTKYKTIYSTVITWGKAQGLNRNKIKQLSNMIERPYEDGHLKRSKEVFVFYEKMKLLGKRLHEVNEPSSHFSLMQAIGNNLRCTGNPFKEASDLKTNATNNLSILSREAGHLIEYTMAFNETKGQGKKGPYFAVECLRNPEEIWYFKDKYRSFYLFAIYADEEKRYERARAKFQLEISDCKNIDQTDQGKDKIIPGQEYRQNIKRCVNLADIAITNNAPVKQNLYRALLKYLALIKRPGCIKPTAMESNMNLAYSMSLNSTCISRQVGAVVIDSGYVVGSGWNDTDEGRIGCIYRHREDVENTDNRSFPLCQNEDYDVFCEIIKDSDQSGSSSFCYKDEYEKLLSTKTSKNGSSKGKGSKFKLLQYCRALHAEENALLQAAKIGGVGLKDATIYTTTFPCELCAKKILQVGINKVVYCEPYPQTLSLDVFFKEGLLKPEIIPFEGVKSPSYFRLFKPRIDIKDMQVYDSMLPGKLESD